MNDPECDVTLRLSPEADTYAQAHHNATCYDPVPCWLDCRNHGAHAAEGGRRARMMQAQSLVDPTRTNGEVRAAAIRQLADDYNSRTELTAKFCTATIPVPGGDGEDDTITCQLVEGHAGDHDTLIEYRIVWR